MGFTLDLIGGSNMLWRQKHNILHHTYTNISGADDDLETSGLLRLSPDQPWRPWHRFQYLYALLAYSFLSLSWMMYNDFKKYFSKRIGNYPLRKNRPAESVSFFMTKTLYFSYMLVIPMFFHPILHVVAFFVGMHLILGLTLSVVFQLAHTLVDAEFPAPQNQSGQMDNEWAVHQLITTADFARNSRLATWYLGGLNFQVEHHLFSKICHIHYPKISTIVEQTTSEFSVPYKSHPTLWAAIRAHFRFLKQMAQPQAA